MSDPKPEAKPEKQATICHSRYAPDAEARRHLDSSLAGRQPALLFILGAGRNYLGQAIRQTLPNTLTVVLQPCTDFDSSLVDPGDLYWSPGSPLPLEKILAEALASGKAAGGVALIEWPPAARNCRQALADIQATLQQALELYTAESATSAFWGRRWIKNSLDFVCGDGPLAMPGTGSTPVVIACAGPGLHDAIPAIRTAGNHIRLWALASAHQALLKEGLEPELVLGTDPGFWNGAHLAMVARKGSLLAATPSTRLGASILDGHCPIVPVSTGLGFELDALAAIGIAPGISAMASGTAAGSALSVACTLNTGPVYLCGLDLAAQGLAEHAFPYAFDILDKLRASRLSPDLAWRFARVMDRYPGIQGTWRLSRTFSTYALDAAIRTSRADVFRVSSSPVDAGINRIHPDQLLFSQPAGQAAHSMGKVQFFTRSFTGKTRFEAMVDLLRQRSERALATLKECACAGLPVPRETALELFAFGGKGCAPAIANAARGKTSKQDIQEAEIAASSGSKYLAGGNP